MQKLYIFLKYTFSINYTRIFNRQIQLVISFIPILPSSPNLILTFFPSPFSSAVAIRNTIIPSTKNTEIAPTPIFTFPVTCEIRLITVVPRKDAPFPHMSISPKYSPDFSGGMILAKYDRDNA